jgi:hypothetical protein
VKQGDVLSPLLFNCVFVYGVTRVQAKQVECRLGGTHKLNFGGGGGILFKN